MQFSKYNINVKFLVTRISHYHASESTVSYQNLAPKRVTIVLIKFVSTLFTHLSSPIAAY
ncbi:protein of unknown function [Brevefilum fermentans]|uniref:Uncharacterized protein n=1 Tax=Candidatus Brevifilum fermentans TaxID=1986204 RepID=A0A1Y6K3G3_9CHLR|nr:protein of unknown function [Brevefilum fermentans]